MTRQPDNNRWPPVAPALLLGIGLGGFVDGIALHQIRQRHHTLTATSGYPAITVQGLEARSLTGRRVAASSMRRSFDRRTAAY
jgi:uncharacterized membrane protein